MSNLEKQNTAVEGSIFDVARATNRSAIDILHEVECVVLLDVSASMDDRLHSGKSRLQAANEQLGLLQKQYPGKVLVASFSDTARIVLEGNITKTEGSTLYKPAFACVEPFLQIKKIFLISDGAPHDIDATLDYLSNKTVDLTTIFIGNDGDHYGLSNLERLANATKGKSMRKIDPLQLKSSIAGLLPAPSINL